MSRKYKLVVFVPEANIEELKTALFSAGAGKQGNYDSCSWQVLGTGQFRPLPGSNPSIGKHSQVEKLAEYRLETLVDQECLKAVVAALRATHPYEEPAFELVALHPVE